jgi:GTP pyrophosphokinase
VVDLPRGATPLDFAYHVHTDLGHRCRGAKINGRIVPLNQPLANGQVVEIITGKQLAPSRDWLSPDQGFLASPEAAPRCVPGSGASTSPSTAPAAARASSAN